MREIREASEHKLIFSGNMARYLLGKGYTIVDVKADKYVENKSVFVFKIEGDLLKEIDSFNK